MTLVMLMVLTSVVGCSKGDKKDSASKNSAKEIVVAARAGAMADALEVLAGKYKEETGTKVKITAMPYDALKEKKLFLMYIIIRVHSILL